MIETKKISYEKTQNSLEQPKESFVFLKEDILNPYFKFKLKQKILDFSQKKTLFESDGFGLIDNQLEKVFSILKEKNLDLKDLEKIKILKNGKLNIYYKKNGKTEKLVFDLNREESIFLGDEEELKQQKEHLNLQAVKNLENANRILQAMDYVFNKNEEEWFDELNDEDILDTDKFGKDLKGKNLKQLQQDFKKYFDKIPKDKIKDLNPDIRKEYLKQSQKYLEMFMGVGDTYEGGVKYLKETQKKFENIALNIINFSSPRQTLNYLKELHRKIDDNNYQSISVERAYEILMKTTFHQEILKKLKKEKVEDKYLLEFAKIITGRGVDIDDLLRDQETANEALLYMMNRKGGIIDKLKQSGEIEVVDKDLEKKSLKQIVLDLEKAFYRQYDKTGKLKEKNIFKTILFNAGYGDILKLADSSRYIDLDYEQRVKLGVLNKVLEKLKKSNKNRETSLEEFPGLFKEVAKDSLEELSDDLEDNFDSNNIFSSDFWFGKDAKELGLTGVQAEAFDLFQDIIGNGVFDLSDTSIKWLKTGGKFAGVLVVAITVPMVVLPATIGATGMGAAMGATASLASMAINPHGYDTIEEGIADITSDITLGAVTGAIGGAWAAKFEGQTYKAFSKDFYKNQKMIMALDLAFLGLGPEMGRMWLINQKYHSEAVLQQTKNNKSNKEKK